MVKLALHSIAYEAKTLNLAKTGYTAFYVDGTNGSDAHDGGSWGQAFKTIQHAIDESESWAKIFVKNGAYSEAVLVPSSKPNVMIIGESAAGTIITSPSSSAALTIEADNVYLSSVHCISGAGATLYSIYVNAAKNFSLSNVKSSGIGSDPLNLNLYNSTEFLVELFKPTGLYGIVVSGCSQTVPRPSITHCIFDGCTLNIANLGSKYNIIKDCTFLNAGATYGAVRFFASAAGDKPTKNIVTHCNFIDCTKTIKVENAATDNYITENFYSGHSNVDNGYGIAKAPFTDDLTDPRPVVIPAGWLGLSWADADQVGDIKSRNVSMMEFWSDNDTATMLSTSTADLPLPDVVVAGIPSGATIIRVIGMIDIEELYNSSTTGVNAISGAAVINVKKSTGAWGTDDVALINIPNNSFPVLTTSRRKARMYIGDNDAKSEVDGNATYNLRFNGNIFVDYNYMTLTDVAVGLRVYFTP